MWRVDRDTASNYENQWVLHGAGSLVRLRCTEQTARLIADALNVTMKPTGFEKPGTIPLPQWIGGLPECNKLCGAYVSKGGHAFCQLEHANVLNLCYPTVRRLLQLAAAVIMLEYHPTPEWEVADPMTWYNVTGQLRPDYDCLVAMAKAITGEANGPGQPECDSSPNAT